MQKKKLEPYTSYEMSLYHAFMIDFFFLATGESEIIYKYF